MRLEMAAVVKVAFERAQRHESSIHANPASMRTDRQRFRNEEWRRKGQTDKQTQQDVKKANPALQTPTIHRESTLKPLIKNGPCILKTKPNSCYVARFRNSSMILSHTYAERIAEVVDDQGVRGVVLDCL